MYLIPSASINSPIHLCRRHTLSTIRRNYMHIAANKSREIRAVTDSQKLHNAFHTIQIAFSEWRLCRWQRGMCHCCLHFSPPATAPHTSHTHLLHNSQALINSFFSSLLSYYYSIWFIEFREHFARSQACYAAKAAHSRLRFPHQNSFQRQQQQDRNFIRRHCTYRVGDGLGAWTHKWVHITHETRKCCDNNLFSNIYICPGEQEREREGDRNVETFSRYAPNLAK